MTATNPYEVGLDKNAANFAPLTPIGFLLRSASVYPNRLAVVYGERRYSWGGSRTLPSGRWRVAASDAATPSR